MLSIFNSESFQNDLSRYTNEIKKIDNVDVKTNCQTLLDRLISEVNKFDKEHEQLIFSRDIRDSQSVKQSMVDIRKALERKIEEYKKTVQIRSKQSS